MSGINKQFYLDMARKAATAMRMDPDATEWETSYMEDNLVSAKQYGASDAECASARNGSNRE